MRRAESLLDTSVRAQQADATNQRKERLKLIPADVDMPVSVDHIPDQFALLREQVLHVNLLFGVAGKRAEEFVDSPVLFEALQLVRVDVIHLLEKS